MRLMDKFVTLFYILYVPIDIDDKLKKLSLLLKNGYRV